MPPFVGRDRELLTLRPAAETRVARPAAGARDSVTPARVSLAARAGDADHDQLPQSVRAGHRRRRRRRSDPVLVWLKSLLYAPASAATSSSARSSWGSGSSVPIS
jgi:hypothetical protein